MFTTVTLDTPIARGDTSIASVQVRKPGTGELRGLKLADVVQSDVDTMVTLLPRITVPPLTEVEVAAMDVSDFLAAANALLGFLPQMGPSAASPSA